MTSHMQKFHFDSLITSRANLKLEEKMVTDQAAIFQSWQQENVDADNKSCALF